MAPTGHHPERKLATYPAPLPLALMYVVLEALLVAIALLAAIPRSVAAGPIVGAWEGFETPSRDFGARLIDPFAFAGVDPVRPGGGSEITVGSFTYQTFSSAGNFATIADSDVIPLPPGGGDPLGFLFLSHSAMGTSGSFAEYRIVLFAPTATAVIPRIRIGDQGVPAPGRNGSADVWSVQNAFDLGNDFLDVVDVGNPFPPSAFQSILFFYDDPGSTSLSPLAGPVALIARYSESDYNAIFLPAPSAGSLLCLGLAILLGARSQDSRSTQDLLD